MILAQEMLQGAEDAGANTELVRLSKLRIDPCAACYACRRTPESTCVIQDDMGAVLDSIRGADALILASPIYFASVNGPMKTFLDRWFSLFGGGGPPIALRGKRLALAFSYGDPDPFLAGMGNALQMFKDAATHLGMDMRGWVHASCVEQNDVLQNTDVLKKARDLGRSLVV